MSNRGAVMMLTVGLALVGALPTQGATTWTATASGCWTNAATWGGGGTPGNGDDAVINSGVSVTADVSTATLNNFTNNGTLTFIGWSNTVLTATVVRVNGTVTHAVNSATTTNESGQWVPDNRVYLVCSNLTVAVGGSINVDQKGYQEGPIGGVGCGPGGGSGVSVGCGGGYGGAGGIGQNGDGGVTNYLIPYGSVSAPVDPGSGGGSYSVGNLGNKGGGAVRIQASGSVTINGSISANGGGGFGYGASGSGGGIYIVCNTFGGANTGSLSANGGIGGSAGGGGGRIAVVYDPAAQNDLNLTNKPAVQFSANAGTGSSSQGPGRPGTLYLPDQQVLLETLQGGFQWRIPTNSWTPGNLLVSNAISANCLVVFPDAFQLGVKTNLTLSGTGIEITNSVITVGGDFNLLNAGRLTVYSGMTNAPGQYGALVSVTGDVTLATATWIYPYSHPTNGGSPLFRMRHLTIATNAGFDANVKGFAGGPVSSPGYGPGGGPGGGVGCGGGYGGAGGVGQNGDGGVTNYLIPYGSVSAPVDPGSGGGSYSAGNPGGKGGGAVRIQASGAVTINGSISANGGGGVSYGASGSGGGIHIVCSTFGGTNTGGLSANGGTGGSAGGGGGRVAVIYDPAAQNNLNLTNKPAVQFSVNAGIGNSHLGRPGTLYLPDLQVLPETLQGGFQWRIPTNSWTPGNLLVSNAASTNCLVIFPDAFQLGVQTNLTLNGTEIEITNSVITVGGDLNLLNAGKLTVYSGMTNAAAGYGALVSVAGDMTLATATWIYPYSHPTNGGSPLFRMRDLTIATNAGFDANAKGFIGGSVGGAGYGPGGGPCGSGIGCGGGYGGAGGRGLNGDGGVTNYLIPYGSSNAPVDPGSGGGGGSGSVGGNGGGAVQIQASGTVTINGQITANGQKPSVGSGYGAGGSGGGIYLTCRRIAGTDAIVTANGGDGASANAPGYGGGGRIAMWRLYDQTSGVWTVTAAGATNAVTSSRSGLDGTICWGQLRPGGTIFVVH